MSRFQKLSHVIWHCQYHCVWVPKYRYKVLKGKIVKFRNDTKVRKVPRRQVVF